MYAPPQTGRMVPYLSGTKPECALESTASQSVHLSRIGWRTRGGACPVFGRTLLIASSHTSQKARRRRHPRLGGGVPSLPTFGNEAGMCPGINGFTKCAPIADWVAHTWRCLPILGPKATRRVSPPSQKAGRMRHPSLGGWVPSLDRMGDEEGKGVEVKGLRK